MKILVLDDSKLHRRVACAVLKDHNLTVVGTYGEAEMAILDEDFDAALIDSRVPASPQTRQTALGQMYMGTEQILGPTLALLAITRGVKRVAVITDADHHDDPASAAFDCFPALGVVGDLRIICANWCAWFDEETLEMLPPDFVDSSEGQAKYPNDTGLVWSKPWHQILTKLCSC
jgi:hypothetical protein